MPRSHALDAVDASIFSTASRVHRFPVRLAAPPDEVWASLTSDDSIGAWGLGIRVRWTSTRPFGVGTTREVRLPAHAMTVRERFFRWDEGTGYSFFVESSNRAGLRAVAEDYVLEPDGNGTLFTWTIAVEPRPWLGKLLSLAGPVNAMVLGQLPAAARRHFAQGNAQ